MRHSYFLSIVVGPSWLKVIGWVVGVGGLKDFSVSPSLFGSN